MTRPTLLLLGGSRLIVPVIEAAHARGVRVVTCDYLPDNYAHSFSDEYRDVSIIDHEAVLATAQDVGADGIMSFAADPGVLAAAYAAEELELPFQGSYEAVRVLQTKDLFRAFLAENGFNSPHAVRVGPGDDVLTVASEVPFPVIVKPVDSAGSKGVTRVDAAADMVAAIEFARSFSRSGVCIVEQFIELRSNQLVAEGFIHGGRFCSINWMDHHFDADGVNPYVPAGHVLSSAAPAADLGDLETELQRVAELLSLGTGIYNIEARLGTDGLAYIMEVSPRGGGNRLAELVTAASDFDLIGATTDAALGRELQIPGSTTYDGVWHNRVLFSRHGGTYGGLEFDVDFAREHVRDVSAWVEPGDRVEAFSASNFAFGSAFLRFDDRAQLATFLADPEASMRVVVE